MKLSVVIPVYNEEKTIITIINKVLFSLVDLKEKNVLSSFEIIVVDDGSKDNTKSVFQNEFKNRNNEIIFHNMNKNQGKGAAVRKGIEISIGDYLLIQDADMEYDPKDYFKLLNPIRENNADVVYGSRFKGETVRVLYFWHYLGNQFLTFLSNMFSNLNLTDMECCYKLFRSSIIKNMIINANRFGIEPEVTAKIAKIPHLRIYEVPVSYDGRTYSEGKKIGWKDGFSAIWHIVKYNLFTDVTSSYKTNFNFQANNFEYSISPNN